MSTLLFCEAKTSRACTLHVCVSKRFINPFGICFTAWRSHAPSPAMPCSPEFDPLAQVGVLFVIFVLPTSV